MNKQLIGNNLRFLRLSKKWKQREMAAQVFTGRENIYAIEQGKVTLAILIRYGKIFNKSLDELCFKDVSINQ